MMHCYAFRISLKVASHLSLQTHIGKRFDFMWKSQKSSGHYRFGKVSGHSHSLNHFLSHIFHHQFHCNVEILVKMSSIDVVLFGQHLFTYSRTTETHTRVKMCKHWKCIEYIFINSYRRNFGSKYEISL